MLNGRCSGICGGTSYGQTSNPSLEWKKWMFSKLMMMMTMMIEPRITEIPLGFSGYIWLDKICVEKKKTIYVFSLVYNIQKNDEVVR